MNASLWARITTIAAGPLANYFFASVLFFAGYMIAGKPVMDEASLRVSVPTEEANVKVHSPAHQADLRDGDRIVTINGEAIPNWDQLKRTISAHPGEKIDVEIERGGQAMHLPITPGPKGDENYDGKIGIRPEIKMVKVSVGEAAYLSVTDPAKFVAAQVVGLARTQICRERAA